MWCSPHLLQGLRAGWAPGGLRDRPTSTHRCDHPGRAAVPAEQTGRSGRTRRLDQESSPGAATSYGTTPTNCSPRCPTTWAANPVRTWLGARRLRFACEQLGRPYVWGGNGGAGGGFDRSGLTHAAYAAAGVNLPRTAQTQYQAGPLLPADAALEPGDLAFFGTPANAHHVTISLGGTEIVHSPTFGKPVWVTDYRSFNDMLGGFSTDGQPDEISAVSQIEGPFLCVPCVGRYFG